MTKISQDGTIQSIESKSTAKVLRGKMEIRARYIIGDFIEKYPVARKPLKRWEDATKEATWKTPADVKKVFSSVSFVGKTTIFNIGGNKWRLLTHILYEQKSVIITHMLTHKDYDNIKIE